MRNEDHNSKIRKFLDHPVLWRVEIAHMALRFMYFADKKSTKKTIPTLPRAGVLSRDLLSTWLSRTLFYSLDSNTILRLSI